MTAGTYSPETFEPVYSAWRHGGWYVDNIRYPSGAVGCVSKNYPDGKWRIVCDSREGDHTYPSRDAAARAEYDLIYKPADERGRRMSTLPIRFTITRGTTEPAPQWGTGTGGRTITPNGWTYRFERAGDVAGVTITGDFWPLVVTGAYWTGPGLYPDGTVPTARDVMESLLSDATCWLDAADLAEFLVDLGYSGDNAAESSEAASLLRRGIAAYEACHRTHDELAVMLGNQFEDAIGDPEAWLDGQEWAS